jgi:DNA repair protein RadC
MLMPDTEGHRQRLKQRLLEAGAEALADYELLELLLFLAQPRQDMKPLAKTLLKTYGSLSRLFQAPTEDLLSLKGMGPGILSTLKMVHVLALRLAQEEAFSQPLLNTSDQLIRYCRLRLKDINVEQFHVIFVNAELKVIGDEILSTGTINQTAVYPREILRKALNYGATGLILAHNHPSGDPTPSQEDKILTQTLCDLSSLLEITIHEHLILGREHAFSFKDAGLLKS